MINTAKEDSYVLGFWIMELLLPDNPDCHVGNIMLTIKRNEDNPFNWTGEIRFRFYNDSKIFDSDDKKMFYTIRIHNKTESQVLSEAMLHMNEIKEKFNGGDVEFIDIRGGSEKVIEKLKDHPMFHLKTLNQKEYDEQYK